MTETQYLADILILLAAAIITVPVFQRLGLGAVLGYLAAGAIVGPWGFEFISEIQEIRHIAEFGVVFLLFLIGIELRPARLWEMRRMVFGLGTAQVMVTGLVIAGLALLMEQTPRTALIIGFGLALSSTAFGLQILPNAARWPRHMAGRRSPCCCCRTWRWCRC
jgi:Kef-type K+ transport system membrane component KefB